MIAAGYFDGKTSRRHAVRLAVTAQELTLAGDGWQRKIECNDVRVSEPIGGAPRTLTFADGGYCEVAQGQALDALLAELGHTDRAVARWQKSWRLAAFATLAMAVILAAGYRWGLPWAAERIAPRIPGAAVASMSENALKLMDQQLLKPSTVPAERQEELDRVFRRLVASDPATANGTLRFRSAPSVGPNAFALPDGNIVVFDELIALADNDEEVLAVLAHELGHVKYRHGLRQLIQSSVVAAVAAGYFGDVSSLLSGLSALLLESKYSRGFELEADAYGGRLMQGNGYLANSLATMLEKLERAHEKGDRPTQSSADWLSSHPDTADRIARLRAMH